MVDLFGRDFIVLAGCGDQAWVDARAGNEPNAPRADGPRWNMRIPAAIQGVDAHKHAGDIDVVRRGIDDRPSD
jgi:hypothetical protein